MTRTRPSIWEAVIGGFFLGLMVGGMTMLIATESSIFWRGYNLAYEDMHQGKIEQVIRDNSPKLWIKYNAKEERKWLGKE